MDIRKIEPAIVKMNNCMFEREKKENAYRKKRFVFVKSYENFDLYKNKKARLL